MASLPEDLLLRILDLLETRARVRLALVSKEWHKMITSTWTEIFLEPKNDGQIAAQLTWLKRLACRNPTTLHSLKIFLPAPHAAKQSLLLPNTGAVPIQV